MSPCEHHRAMGFTFTVIGCPTCYPALAAPKEANMDNPLTPRAKLIRRMESEGLTVDPSWLDDLAAVEDAARAPSASEDGPTSPYVDREEHERQSTAGTHHFDPHCPFCFFDHFDPEARAELAIGSASEDVGLREALDSDDFRDAHERAMRDHLLARPGGWPHLRTGSMPGDGPQSVDGCDDLCSDDIVTRLRAALRASAAASPTPETPLTIGDLDPGADYPHEPARATPETPSLDAARKAAENALPGPLWQMLVGSVDDATGRGWWATASSPRDEFGGYKVVSTSEKGVLHDSPRDALQALAARLAVKPDDAP